MQLRSRRPKYYRSGLIDPLESAGGPAYVRPMGSRRRQVLALTSDDPVLRWVGPIGLALAAGSTLIVDTGRTSSSGRTLEDLADAGPRLAELSPGRVGVATIGAGRLGGPALVELIDTLAASWPAVVIRTDVTQPGIPSVPYRGLYPGLERDDAAPVSVWQPAIGVRPGSLPGPIMPRLGRRDLLLMLGGRTPAARRWIAAWRRVWEMPWA